MLNLGLRGRILATKLILSPGIQRLKIFLSNQPVNLLQLTEAVFKARTLIVRGVMTFVGLIIDPTIQRLQASESFPACGSLRHSAEHLSISTDCCRARLRWRRFLLLFAIFFVVQFFEKCTTVFIGCGGSRISNRNFANF